MRDTLGNVSKNLYFKGFSVYRFEGTFGSLFYCGNRKYSDGYFLVIRKIKSLEENLDILVMVKRDVIYHTTPQQTLLRIAQRPVPVSHITPYEVF